MWLQRPAFSPIELWDLCPSPWIWTDCVYLDQVRTLEWCSQTSKDRSQTARQPTLCLNLACPWLLCCSGSLVNCSFAVPAWASDRWVKKTSSVWVCQTEGFQPSTFESVQVMKVFSVKAPNRLNRELSLSRTLTYGTNEGNKVSVPSYCVLRSVCHIARESWDRMEALQLIPCLWKMFSACQVHSSPLEKCGKEYFY